LKAVDTHFLWTGRYVESGSVLSESFPSQIFTNLTIVGNDFVEVVSSCTSCQLTVGGGPPYLFRRGF
jgi:hypothetical protein